MGEKKKQLFHDSRAETEADRIGARFMDSTDVVGDMSRAYGVDLSSVRLHADSMGAERVAGTGADAIAQGRDIYFGSGVYQKGDPASNGLLAHELAHTIQQTGGGAGVEVSSPVGAAQGGLKDWFKKLFGGGGNAGDLEISGPMGLTVEGTPTVADTSERFLDEDSRIINTMLQRGSREQLQDPQVRKLVLENYNKNMNRRLLEAQTQGANLDQMDDRAFEGSRGEMDNLSMIVNAALPEDFHIHALDAGAVGNKGSDGGEATLDYISSQVEQNQGLMDILQGTNASFNGVSNYDDPEGRSHRTMLNLLKRSVGRQAAQDKHRMAKTPQAGAANARAKRSESAIMEASMGNSASASRFRLLLQKYMH